MSFRPRHAARALLLPLLLAACPAGRREAARVDMYLGKSRQLARQAMLGEAVLEAEKAVATDPDHAPAQLELGRLLRRVGKESGAGRDDRRGLYRRARETLERTLALDPGNVPARIELALLHDDAGRHAEAVAVLEPPAGEGHAEAQFHLASILAGQSELGRARALFEAGLKARPEDARAQLSLALVLERLGELPASREAVERALAIAPQDVEAWYRMGSVLSKLGEVERAVLAYARAVDLDPENEDALYGLAQAQRRRGAPAIANRVEARFRAEKERREQAIALEERLAANPDDVDSRAELARSYVRRGQLLRALAAARKVLETRPEDRRALLVLADCHQRMGSPDLARLLLDRLAARPGGDGEALEQRGLLRLAQGDLAGAREDLMRAMELGRRSGPLLEGLSRIALLAGELPEAIRIGYFAEKIEPPHMPLYRVLAESLIAAGDPRRASNILSSCLLWKPADLETLRLLLRLAHEAGDEQGAAELDRRLKFLHAGSEAS